MGKSLLIVKDTNILERMEDIAKHFNTKAPVIGRYEREEMKPSIDVVTKIADLLEVSFDYLVGKTDVEQDDAM